MAQHLARESWAEEVDTPGDGKRAETYERIGDTEALTRRGVSQRFEVGEPERWSATAKR